MLPGKTIITTDTSLKEMKKNARNKAINEFAERMIVMMPGHRQDIEQIAYEMRGSEENG